jgi:hypothetical protein
MMASAAAFLLIVFVPGALVFRLPWGDRARRAALAFEERAYWAVVLSVAASSAVALGLAIAGRYTFPRLLIGLAALALLAALAGRGALRLGPAAPRPTPTAAIPLALAIASAWLFLRPAEYVLGGKDPGVYLNEGIQIAQRGTVIVRDPVVAAVPPEARDLFFPYYNDPTYYSVRFMGFFVLEPDTGAVLGQFPHLYPVWVAIGYGLNGLSGARQAIGAWAILGVLGVYFLGARLLGRPAAACAAILLAINVVQVWFSRYPNAEMLMQALLFAALLANARALVDGDRFFAPIAGALLALLVFLRFDAVLALGAAGAAWCVALADRRRISPAFVITLALGSLLAAVYLGRVMEPYASYPIDFAIRNWWLAAGPVAAIAGLVLAARRESTAASIRSRLPQLLALVIVAGAIYGYFLRGMTGRTAQHDADSVRTFAWYLTRGGLLASVAGYAIAVRRHFWRSPAFFLTAAVFALFFFHRIRIVPDHFWMARRYLGVLLPAAVLMASAAAFRLAPGLLPHRWRNRLASVRMTWVPPVLALLPLAWHFWSATSPIRDHVEYAGVIPRLERLAARFGDRDLVLIESRNASDMHVLALPLAYIYARNVLVLNSPRPDRTAFGRFLESALDRYEHVYFVGGGGTDLLSRDVAVRAVASERFQVPEYESPRNAYPQRVRQKEFDYGVYQLLPGSGSQAPWFALDVGTMDDLHVVRFHAKEQLDGRTFRWSRDVSYVTLLGMRADSRTLVLWLNDGGRPPGAPPARVTVSIENRQLGEVTVARGFAPYTFGIPPEIAAAAGASGDPARLRLGTATWNPRNLLGVGDDRELGVMVDRVEVR